MPGLLLLSWNVASWPTALRCIDAHHSGLGAWLARHRADVVALQEVKATAERLEADAAASCKHLEGWEAFWAPCRDGRKGKAGFNGVATLCRAGLVRRADRAPLRDADLDAEGRCLATDHGAFVLFNTYAPSGGATSPGRRMRFLRALRAAMQRERAAGKNVVLCGDLNVSRRAADVAPGWALLPLEDVWGSPRAPGLAALPPPLAAAVLDARPRAEWCLRQRRVEVRRGRSSGASGAYVPNEDAYVARVPTDDAKTEWVSLGKWSSAESAERDLGMEALSADDGEGGSMPLRRAGCLHAESFQQLLRAAGVELGDDALAELVAAVGVSPTGACFREWIDALVVEDGMVDTFAEVRPGARGRFTCWHQYTNRRYENEGTRIDYWLCDGAIAPCVRAGGALFGGGDDSRAALRAALGTTPCGQRYTPAPFDGSGMQEPPTTVLDTQFGEPHTGIVYTPPGYSDHVAVSLLLEWSDGGEEAGEVVAAGGGKSGWRGPAEGSLELASDKATRACQPHRSSRSIKDMFGKFRSKPAALTPSAGAAGGAAGGPESRLAPPPSAQQQQQQQRRRQQQQPGKSKRMPSAAAKRAANPVASMFARHAKRTRG